MPRRNPTQEADRLSPPWSSHSAPALRLLAAQLTEETKLAPPGLAIDLGCGAKPYEELFPGGLVGFDLAFAHGRPDCLARAEQLPVRDGCAAVVLSTQQLEHVDDPHAVLVEARRVLTDDGVLLLSTHGVWVHHPDPQDLWRWTEQGLERAFANAGLEVVRIHRQGEVVLAAFLLASYPLGAVRRSTNRPIRALAALLLRCTNPVVTWVDRHVSKRLPRHYASAGYLVVARRAPRQPEANATASAAAVKTVAPAHP